LSDHLARCETPDDLELYVINEAGFAKNGEAAILRIAVLVWNEPTRELGFLTAHACREFLIAPKKSKRRCSLGSGLIAKI
jgi:hypothetical protein